MRLQLIDGQGNFGSVDGDPAAAMRYTECRLAKPAMALLDDIDKNTVDFQANYDGNEHEPVVLPARYPNLLVNGAGGIAVGMATNIPPHNLGEVIDACVAVIDDPAISTDDLIAIVPGPDFPTGGIILGRAGIHSAYHTGRGSVVMRGKVAFETLGQGTRSDHHFGNSLSGEQGHHGRAHRRTGARQEDRRHFRPARRIRPRRLSRGDRVEARRRARRGDEPALSLHAAADEFRRQHRGARRRPSAGDEAQGYAGRLRRVPRRGGVAPHQVPAHQGARPRPCVGGLGHRGRQYRRGDQADPRLEGRQGSARRLDGARVAGQGHGDHGDADRRSAPPRVAGRQYAAVGRTGAGHSRSAPAAPDCARPRGNQAKSSTSSPPKSPTISISCVRACASRPSSRTISPR